MKRSIAILLVVQMICMALAGTVMAIPTTTSEEKSNGIDITTVKARLVTLGSKITELDIVLKGEYYVKENGKSVADCELTLKIVDGKVLLYKNGSAAAEADEINICRRSQVKDAGYVIIGERKYLGDFRFRQAENSSDEIYLQVINHVPMAYYLYGVLYGEMGNSTHIDALKSQALAAKCYCIKSMKAGSNYDIGDTSATQVYRGYDPSWTNIIEAVDSTINEVVTYDGEILKTFYASSNGGETDLPTNAWGGADSLNNGFALEIDEYDFNSTGIKETLEVKMGEDTDRNSDKFLQMLLGFAKAYSDETVVELVSIDDCEVNKPKHSGSKRNMTNLYVKLTVLVGKSADDEDLKEKSIAINIDVAELLRQGIFDDDRLRMYWGQDTDEGTYEIYHVRFGHGVGLSQRGAKYRAQSGQDYEEILGFYYPDAEITYANIGMPGNTDNGGGDTVPMPIPVPTVPMPISPSGGNQFDTEMAKDDIDEQMREADASKYAPFVNIDGGIQIQMQENAEGYAYVKVAGAELKSSPSGVVINRLSYGDMLTVIKSGDEWIYVRTHNSMTGYVKSEYVNTIDKTNGDNYTYKLGKVNTDSVNFRAEASTSSESYGRIAKDATLYIWGTSGEDDWYYVQYGLTYGYVYAEYVDVRGTYTAVSVAAGSVVASGITKSEVNLRPSPSTTGNSPIRELEGGTYILIYSYEDGWYSVNAEGLSGYIRGDYVTVNTAIPISPENISNPVEPQPMGTGVINDTNVRFRSAPTTSDSNNIIELLQRGTEITLFSLENNWYYAKHDGKMGYVYAEYVDVVSDGGAPQVPDAAPTLAKGRSTASVNFRVEANTDCEVILKMPKNVMFDVIGKYGDGWLFVRYEGRCGFVSTKYSEVTLEGNIDLIEVAEDWASYETVTSESVNFRTGPSTNYSVIQKLPEGAKLTVLAITQNDWCLVLYNDILLGFVTHRYLEK